MTKKQEENLAIIGRIVAIACSIIFAGSIAALLSECFSEYPKTVAAGVMSGAGIVIIALIMNIE
jgi:predicted RecA/RadA family phage recombinase